MSGHCYLFIGSAHSEQAEIIARLERDGNCVIFSAGPENERVVDGAVLKTDNAATSVAFLDLSDAEFASAVKRFVQMTHSLQQVLARIRDGGSIVVITSRGYLGAWGGAHEMALSAATVALMRSIALESMGRGVRANVIAVEPAASNQALGAAPAEPRSVAELVSFLLSQESALINGEVILANAGRSLQMREARDRRSQALPSIQSRSTA